MPEISVMKTPAELALNEAFAAAAAGLPGPAAERRAAFNDFVALGLPHRRVEAFKYTDLRAKLRDARPLAPLPDAVAVEAARAQLATLPVFGPRLVLVDGAYAPTLSDMMALDGVSIASLAASLEAGDAHTLSRMGSLAPAKPDPVLALNAAFVRDGFVIKVAAGMAVEAVIDIVSITSSAASHMAFGRVILDVGASASVSVVERFIGPAGAATLTNAVTELFAADGARVSHIRFQDDAAEAIHLSTLLASIGTEANLEAFSLVTGASLSRHQIFATYAGDGAKVDLSGVSLLAGRQHADTTLVMDHAKPGGESRELFKHVLADEATGVFQGKIIVAPIAQKTDGQMMSQAIMLDDGPQMMNKPELEIFADDVVCAHGATSGTMDEDLLFYLESRGIPPIEAKALLVTAFAGEAIEKIAVEAVRNAALAAVERFMDARK